VFERTRELGMLMALGMRPVQVIALILAEAAGLALASLVVGGAVGVPLLWYLQVHGLDLGGATGEVVSLAGVVVGHLWYGRQDFPVYSQAALGLAATALVSALYPAWRAAQLRPTEAIRKV
jgi:putative ABC transport system permease protein